MIDMFLTANDPIDDIAAALSGLPCQRVMVRAGGNPTEIWQRSHQDGLWQQDVAHMTLFEDLAADLVEFEPRVFQRENVTSALTAEEHRGNLRLTPEEAKTWLDGMARHRYAIEDAIGCTFNLTEENGVVRECAAAIVPVSQLKHFLDPHRELDRKILAWTTDTALARQGADEINIIIAVARQERRRAACPSAGR